MERVQCTQNGVPMAIISRRRWTNSLVMVAVQMLALLLSACHQHVDRTTGLVPTVAAAFMSDRRHYASFHRRQHQQQSKHQLQHTSTNNDWRLFASPSNINKDWKLPNDFPTFLNQCAIQSFLFLISSLRDPHTVRWMHNYTEPVITDRGGKKSTRLTGTTDETMAMTSSVQNPNGNSYSKLLTFHGLGAMNTTKFHSWEQYFTTLLELPPQTVVIQSSSVHAPDYELDINPASLCSRVISVREQIAREMAHDLGIIAKYMGNHTMHSYYHYPRQQRDLTNKGDVDDGTMSSGGATRKLPPHNLVFLDYSLDPLGDMIPSPLRKGNFDLLVLLATQESIVRILNGKATTSTSVDARSIQMLLREFYTERISSHFEGIQRYGRADDFLEELLFSPPRRVHEGGDGATLLVDPVPVAEAILQEREQVALEWQAMCQDVPNDHMVIKRIQLDKLMASHGVPGSKPNNDYIGDS